MRNWRENIRKAGCFALAAVCAAAGVSVMGNYGRLGLGNEKAKAEASSKGPAAGTLLYGETEPFGEEYNGYFCIDDNTKASSQHYVATANGKPYGWEPDTYTVWAGWDSSGELVSKGSEWNISDSYELFNSSFDDGIWLYHEKGFYYNGSWYDVIEFPRIVNPTGSTVDDISCRLTYAVTKSGYSFAHSEWKLESTSDSDVKLGPITYHNGKEVTLYRIPANHTGNAFISRRFFFYQNDGSGAFKEAVEHMQNDVPGASVSYSSGTVQVNGTTYAPSDVKGIIQARDLDTAEWMASPQADLDGIHTADPTYVTLESDMARIFADSGKGYTEGPVAVGTCMTDEAENVNAQCAWIPFDTGSDKCLELDYGPGTASGAGVNYTGATVEYKYVDREGSENLPSWMRDGAMDGSIQGVLYGTFAPPEDGIDPVNLTAEQALELSEYQFDGWYTDSTLTTEYTEHTLVDGLTIYGTYEKIPVSAEEPEAELQEDPGERSQAEPKEEPQEEPKEEPQEEPKEESVPTVASPSDAPSEGEKAKTLFGLSDPKTGDFAAPEMLLLASGFACALFFGLQKKQ